MSLKVLSTLDHFPVSRLSGSEEEHLIAKHHSSPVSPESQSSLESSSSSSCPEMLASLDNEVIGSEAVLLMTTATSVVGDGGRPGGTDRDVEGD